MSKGSKKTMKVTYPVISVRRGNMSESKGRLEEKKEELEGLRVKSDILDLEERIERRRSGGAPAEPKKDDLAEKLVTEVVLPIVRKNLEGDKDSSVAREALTIAKRAQDRADKTVREAPPASSNTITDIVNALGKFKDLIKDDSTKDQLDKVTEQLKELQKKKPEASRELGKEYTEFLDFYDKMQERIQPKGSSGSTDGYYDFEKWKVQQDRKNTMQDRAWTLRLRQQDKEQEARMIELGLKKDGNDIIRDGLKKLGAAVGDELASEDDYEEDEKPDTKGRKQLLKEKCTQCGAELLIPPEAQVAGKEIKCSKCNAIFTWE